jgi:hypothetical protein
MDLATLSNPGLTRPVYLWAGQPTIDLQRVKFPDIPIDVRAHLRAHQEQGVAALRSLGVNIAFLSMNWGFPPEIEREHWREFAQARRLYNEAGIDVLAYVQASNCVASGSFADADWFALDHRGRRIPYYHRRFMTCWNHEGWIQQVRTQALRALEAGAQGVFFDNVWMGATPWVLGGALGGFAGCACGRCHAAYRRDTQHSIPVRLENDRPSESWLRWRAGIVQQRFADWCSAIRAHTPGAMVSSNSCDVVLRDTTGLFGLDYHALAPLQDALLVENVAMPRYDAARRRLVANALPLKAVRAAASGKPIFAVTYEHGIGLDASPSPRRLRRAICEGHCGRRRARAQRIRVPRPRRQIQRHYRAGLSAGTLEHCAALRLAPRPCLAFP